MYRLVKVCTVVGSKYSRSKVRKAIPKEYQYIIDELLHANQNCYDRDVYYDKIIDSIISLGRADAFIIAISNLIQQLAVDHLHIIGDIYDRGPGPHIIIDELMKYHSIDIQWGNHDIIWMGAAAGSEACIFNVIRICARYNNLDILEEGYGIIQPRVGVNLDISYKTLFTKIFAGAGGFDSYSNAISDTYQDNFGEGIFTGKGIYDLHVFSKILNNKIPENTVLSHDLLEGCYLRSGLASDILLMDGYPTKYNSFMTRLSRWTRGDWQILKWISKKSNLNLLSRYKIFDNLRRSLLEISIIFGMIYVNIVGLMCDKSIYPYVLILSLVSIFPFLLEILNHFIFKKEGEKKQKTFTPKISGIKGAIYRGILTFGTLPYKAYSLEKAIIKTIYRMKISKKHLLEWTTSEEAERNSKTTVVSYYNQMWVNFLAGLVAIGLGVLRTNIFAIFIGVLWIIIPLVMWYISKEEKEIKNIEKINKEEKEYILDIGKRTWEFFKTYLIEEYNYLIPDNYQEDRKEKVVPRTSSTNIRVITSFCHFCI